MSSCGVHASSLCFRLFSNPRYLFVSLADLIIVLFSSAHFGHSHWIQYAFIDGANIVFRLSTAIMFLLLLAMLGYGFYCMSQPLSSMLCLACCLYKGIFTDKERESDIKKIYLLDPNEYMPMISLCRYL